MGDTILFVLHQLIFEDRPDLAIEVELGMLI